MCSAGQSLGVRGAAARVTARNKEEGGRIVELRVKLQVGFAVSGVVCGV
jgi:hypothetical protein